MGSDGEPWPIPIGWTDAGQTLHIHNTKINTVHLRWYIKIHYENVFTFWQVQVSVDFQIKANPS